MSDVSQFLDKKFEGKEFSELVDAPIDAIQGVSANDAEALKKAFNIKTIEDLATNKYVLVAQGIMALSGAKQAKR